MLMVGDNSRSRRGSSTLDADNPPTVMLDFYCWEPTSTCKGQLLQGKKYRQSTEAQGSTLTWWTSSYSTSRI